MSMTDIIRRLSPVPLTEEQLGLMMTGSLDLTEEKKYKHLGFAKDSNLTEDEWEKAENAKEILNG